MRKITVLAFISLDGVMQAPGGPEEDTSNGFKYGGWTAPLSDETSGATMQKEMEPGDLLLGRKTFEIFSNYWPSHAQYWPGVNDVAKYALSNTLKDSDKLVTQWNNSKVLNSIDDIKALKNTEGANIKVWGSSELVKLLLEHDLVDEFWLNTYPVILGKGKKLFGDTAMPGAFKLADSFVTGTGVFMANYHRNGDVQTGSFNE